LREEAIAILFQEKFTGGHREYHAEVKAETWPTTFFFVSYQNPPNALLSNCDQEYTRTPRIAAPATNAEWYRY